jgi:hypothetical protein
MKSFHAIVSVLVLTAFSTAFAQQPVAPTPKTGKVLSLAETMQLLQKELNAFGKSNFTVITRDELGGPDHIAPYTSEISHVVADSASCTVRYHWKSSSPDNVNVLEDSDFSLNLHDVQSVRVMTYVQYVREVDGEDTDHTDPKDWYTKFDPPMLMLYPQVPGDKAGEYGFVFADEVLANRIAKTLTRAVELCGGGNKKPS